jgi:phosphoribosylanthranilate isomerase
MNINKVTISGADNNVIINDLVNLQEKYPFVEWGILFSVPRSGTDRYPDRHWVTQLDYPLNICAHFCGWYSRQVIEQGETGIISLLPSCVKRLQLNYSFKHTSTWKNKEVLQFIEENQDFPIIFPANKGNQSEVEILSKLLLPNIQFLYDSSGGRGEEIKEIQIPFKDHYTGYAGGLNPDNIKSFCELINDTEDNSNVWLDMETGVRTNDKLDLEKVEKVLSICSKYIKL